MGVRGFFKTCFFNYYVAWTSEHLQKAAHYSSGDGDERWGRGESGFMMIPRLDN